MERALFTSDIVPSAFISPVQNRNKANAKTQIHAPQPITLHTALFYGINIKKTTVYSQC